MGLDGFIVSTEGEMRDSDGGLPQSRQVGCRTEKRIWKSERSSHIRTEVKVQGANDRNY